MKTIESLTIAIAAVKVSTMAMPDEDVKAALRILQTTRRGEIEKQDKKTKDILRYRGY